MEKTGGGAGFETYVALSLKRQAGILVAVTEGKGRRQINLHYEANNLLAALANVPALPPTLRRFVRSGRDVFIALLQRQCSRFPTL
jgi:hypothetical protein